MCDVKSLLEEIRDDLELGRFSPGDTHPVRRRKYAIAILSRISLAAVAGALMLGSRRTDSAAPAYELTQLTRDTGLTFQPAISADGKFVAYSSDRGNKQNLDIWLHQVGGGQPVQLTSHEADETSLDFSPDGTKMCFSPAETEAGFT
jgi:dipeptidyl aminopeptidase/acylaminoacyl peptidase